MQRAEEVIDTVVLTLRLWLLGQLVVMVAVGTLSTIGLWLIGVPGALLLGLFAGLLEFVPVIGPLIAAIPAVLVALVESPVTAVYVALLYFGVQQLEEYVITPLAQQRAVHLPPLLTIAAVLIMQILFGILGALVATPLIAALMVLVKMLYLEDVLGKEVELQARR